MRLAKSFSTASPPWHDPNDRELPEIAKTRIDNEVDRWWNACLGEAFEKNALRALVTSRCELFGAVTRITPRSNLAAFKVYPITGKLRAVGHQRLQPIRPD